MPLGRLCAASRYCREGYAGERGSWSVTAPLCFLPPGRRPHDPGAALPHRPVLVRGPLAEEEEDRRGTVVGRDREKGGGGLWGWGVADLETSPNTRRRDCRPPPRTGLRGPERTRKRGGGLKSTAPVVSVAAPERALTFGGQPPGVSGRRGEPEPGGERLGRAGHHAYAVNVSGRELPPPGRPSEVFVVALTGKKKPRR